MPLRKQYSRSPISEAVIDLRTDHLSNSSFEKIRGFCKGIEGAYPTVVDQMAFTMEVGKESSKSHSVPIGLIARNPTNTQVVQARLDGFSFSRLTPYQGWELFRDEAKRLWELYREIVQPKTIVRAGIRYVNKLQLPHESELNGFLNIFPELRPPMPQGLENFFLRVQLAQPEIDCISLISESTLAGGSAQSGLLLDLDLFRIRKLPQSNGDIWELLEVMHAKQDELFEGCITDEIRKAIA